MKNKDEIIDRIGLVADRLGNCVSNYNLPDEVVDILKAEENELNEILNQVDTLL